MAPDKYMKKEQKIKRPSLQAAKLVGACIKYLGKIFNCLSGIVPAHFFEACLQLINLGDYLVVLSSPPLSDHSCASMNVGSFQMDKGIKRKKEEDKNEYIRSWRY